MTPRPHIDILAGLQADLRQIADSVPLSEEMARLMRAVIQQGPIGGNARDLAQILGVPETSLNSRFARIGAASPKRLLQTCRLLFLARLLAEGHHPDDVAIWVGYSSRKALAQAVRTERDCRLPEMAARASIELDAFRSWFKAYTWPTHPLSGSRPAKGAA